MPISADTGCVQIVHFRWLSCSTVQLIQSWRTESKPLHETLMDSLGGWLDRHLRPSSQAGFQHGIIVVEVSVYYPWTALWFYRLLYSHYLSEVSAVAFESHPVAVEQSK